MIQHISATGIQGRFDISADFHPDLNVITGINGSGKTTLLKLLWYLISCNIERIFTEISFVSITLRTTAFELHLKCEQHQNHRIVRITHNIPGLSPISLPAEALAEEPDVLKQLNHKASELFGQSVFFPTFRRIEGGFSLTSSNRMAGRQLADGYVYYSHHGERETLDDAMRELSRRLSNARHTFVASVSTEDIHQLVTTRYAGISESTNKLLLDTASQILIYSRQVEDRSRKAEDVLKLIAEAAKSIETQQEALLKPFNVLSNLVRQLFQSKGIRVGRSTTLGDAPSAIQSDLLSAGEKQMLSFLVYNAFSQNASIFIDEPELSLHVDWQRRLFALLADQGTSNQFFVATHSPFIYQKYADKEILLSASRGE